MRPESTLEVMDREVAVGEKELTCPVLAWSPLLPPRTGETEEEDEDEASKDREKAIPPQRGSCGDHGGGKKKSSLILFLFSF